MGGLSGTGGAGGTGAWLGAAELGDAQRPRERASRLEVLAGVAPFLVLGLAMAASVLPRDWPLADMLVPLGMGAIFLSYLAMLIGLLVG